MTSARDGFLWGASTAAHQIEGNNVNSDFWAMEHAVPRGPRIQEPSGDACDSYHRYREDITLLADAGLTSYRFSFEWARIEPAEGAFSRAELLHYRDMIDACHEHGVTPVVTLHHFTSPRWFAESGGWKRPDAIDRFAAYVAFCSEVLVDVAWIVTINEPNILALFDLMHADSHSSADTATVAMAQMPTPSLEFATRIGAVHRAAVAVLRERTQAKVGWAIACQAFLPTPGNEARFDAVFHAWEGAYLDFSEGDDFIGIQSYTSQPVDANGPVPHPPSPDNTLTGWAYRPDALGINLQRIWKLKRIPLLVTENGIATSDDERRIAYTSGALQGLETAIADGVQVLGYLHWSLLDNYEWGSVVPTFGLVAVDRATFVRTPKPSLAWLGSVASGDIVGRGASHDLPHAPTIGVRT